MDISNGPGVRVSIFMQGCTRRCRNCFNPETWNPDGGKEFTPDTIHKIIRFLQPDHIRGLSILGGEPLFPFMRSEYDPEIFIELLEYVKEKYPEKTIWLWTGYKWEDIPKTLDVMEALKYIDVIVDGEFIEEMKDISLKYAGSTNQRVIDVQKSLIEGHAVLWN